jgi:hypothetical protein
MVVGGLGAQSKFVGLEAEMVWECLWRKEFGRRKQGGYSGRAKILVIEKSKLLYC